MHGPAEISTMVLTRSVRWVMKIGRAHWLTGGGLIALCSLSLTARGEADLQFEAYYVELGGGD